jgi:LacI family transcriptional regulator
MNRRPTILDVADRAGVSKSTVSLVLQRSPRVHPETRAAVERAMGEIGYVYNRAAANLRSSAAGLVGLVVSDLRDPFQTGFVTSLQMALADQGHATLVAHSDDDPELQTRNIASMIEHGVSALVIVPTHGEGGDALDRMIATGAPVLQVLRQIDGRSDAIPFVGFDHAAGSAKATRHLLRLGARNVAFVGGFPGRTMTRERKSGWRDVLRQEGLEEVALHGKTSREFGMAMADRLLADYPDIDSALCYNDRVAQGLMAGIARTGREVGRAFRVVGFEAVEDAAESWPPLSSVSCDLHALASETAARLLDWIGEGRRPEPQLLMPVRLITRSSSTGETE